MEPAVVQLELAQQPVLARQLVTPARRRDGWSSVTDRSPVVSSTQITGAVYWSTKTWCLSVWVHVAVSVLVSSLLSIRRVAVQVVVRHSCAIL